MVDRHQRFALHDVTFAGVSLPAATVDCWVDAHGLPQWLARVLVKSRSQVDNGELSGTTADGRSLSGHVLIGDQQVGPRGMKQTLVVFHGTEALRGL